MTPNIHLEIIEKQQSYQAEKYASTVCQQVISATIDMYNTNGFYKPWAGYLVVDSDVIVGAAGYAGVPENNGVEISYFTFQEYEGKGFATFACSELIKIAKSHSPGVVVFAKTAPEENASTRILSKNGFVYQKVVQDHEIGDAWLWQLAH